MVRIILSRLFADRGHEVRLMSPEYGQPNVKAQKNDDRDAEAVIECRRLARIQKAGYWADDLFICSMDISGNLDLHALRKWRGSRRTASARLREGP